MTLCFLPDMVLSKILENSRRLLWKSPTNLSSWILQNVSVFRVFNQGLKCFMEYTNKCLETNDKRLVVSEITGAKSFYDMLCKDKDFRNGKANISLTFIKCNKHSIYPFYLQCVMCTWGKMIFLLNAPTLIFFIQFSMAFLLAFH